MLYYLNIIALFVVLLSMFYYISSDYKGTLAVRFILSSSTIVVIESFFDLLVPFDVPIGNQLIIVGLPPFIIWMGTFLFLFMYELIEQKKLSARFILLNMLPPFLLTIITLSVTFFGRLTPNAQQNFLIFRYTSGLILIITYYACIIIRRTKINNLRDADQQIINALLIQLQIAWIFLLVWLIQFPLFGMFFAFQLYAFLKLTLVSITITFYFYLFGLYRLKLENEKKRRMRGFKRLLTQFPFAESSSPSENAEETASPRDGRYEKSLLEDKMLNEYAAAVLQYFENNPTSYLNPQFNLKYLAEKTGISHYYLSQVFNIALQTTFSNFLNKKRIDFACMQLDETPKEKVNISQLSEMCGYKSRTSFYHNFKEITGLSPAEYIQKHAR